MGAVMETRRSCIGVWLKPLSDRQGDSIDAGYTLTPNAKRQSFHQSHPYLFEGALVATSQYDVPSRDHLAFS